MFETYQLAAWTVALNLPGYEVSHCAEDAIDGVLRLSVIPKEISIFARTVVVPATLGTRSVGWRIFSTFL